MKKNEWITREPSMTPPEGIDDDCDILYDRGDEFGVRFHALRQLRYDIALNWEGVVRFMVVN